jgi:hypothetical protein
MAWFWPAFWVAWGTMFVIGEGIALFNRGTGDTLSENVWTRVLGMGLTHRAKWTWRTFAVGAFLLWLFAHLTFGLFAG